MGVHIHMSIGACTYVCFYICIYVYVCIYIHEGVYLYIYIYIYIVYIYIYTHVLCIYMYIYIPHVYTETNFCWRPLLRHAVNGLFDQSRGVASTWALRESATKHHGHEHQHAESLGGPRNPMQPT